jgi:Flp pilus assembly protein TadD
VNPLPSDSIDEVSPFDLVRSLVLGAIAVVWLDAFAYLGLVGGISGFGRGRRELYVGLAAAALLGTWFSVRCARSSMPSRHAGEVEPARGAVHLGRGWIALICLLAPALFFMRPASLVLRPTGIAALDAFLVALLPTAALAWSLARGRAHFPSFSFGMIVGYATTELWLLPTFGWTAALGAWALAWIACETRPALERAHTASSGGTPISSAILAALWGTLAGGAALCARPLLFQHVSATRAGLSALVFVALIGVWAGVWFGLALRRVWNSRGWALLGLALVGASAWMCLRNLEILGDQAPFPAVVADGAPHTISWTAIGQAWLYMGFPAVSFGALACCLRPRGAWVPALVVCGTCAGAWLAESVVLPRWFGPRPDGSSPLFVLAHHSAAATIDEVAWNPDGIAARYRTVAALDPMEIVHWQTQRWERDPLWKRLEAAELRLPLRAAPKAPDVWVIGHPGPEQRAVLAGLDSVRRHVLDPLPSPDEGRVEAGVNPQSILWTEMGEGACVVLLAHPEQPSSFALRETSTTLHALESELRSRAGSLWVWCDPRALTPAGVLRELSGWAVEFPAARLYILQDGYAGPLFGLELIGGPRFHAELHPELQADRDTAEILMLSAPVSECIAHPEQRAPTWNWPALEWQAAPSPGPFTLPDGDVLAALSAALTTPVSRPIGRLLHVLELHSRAQIDRPSFQSKWDRIRIDDHEVRAALDLLREHPDFDPTAHLLGGMAEVLFEKREYEILFGLLKEALELRPDVALFHLLLGRVRHELLDPEGAVAEYDLALALDPGSLTIRSELAHIHAEQGRWRLAVPLLEEVWKAKTPADPVIAKALGLGYLELGKFKEARALLEFAWHEAPGDIEIRQAFDRLDALKY